MQPASDPVPSMTLKGSLCPGDMMSSSGPAPALTNALLWLPVSCLHHPHLIECDNADDEDNESVVEEKGTAAWFPAELKPMLAAPPVTAIEKRDVRTGLTPATSLVHRKLLLVLLRDGWTGLITLLRQSTLATTSQRTLLAKAIGAAKRAAQYGFASPGPPPQAVFDALALYDRQIRVHMHMDGGVITMSTISEHQKHLGQSPAGAVFHILLATAHRGTSIASLQAKDIFLVLRPPSPDTLVLRFREGKTEKSTGTYTLSVAAPAWVTTQVMALAQHQYPFKALMKQAQGDLPLRHLRRTALQRMAAHGISAPTMLLFSRHTTETALRHYLGGGVMMCDEASKTTPASMIWLE